MCKLLSESPPAAVLLRVTLAWIIIFHIYMWLMTCVINSQGCALRKTQLFILQMNTSQGGGVCDCGDVEAWKDGHACEVHQQGQDEDMDEVQHMCTSYTIIQDLS